MAPEPDSIDELQEQESNNYDGAVKGEKMSIAELLKGAEITPSSL